MKSRRNNKESVCRLFGRMRSAATLTGAMLAWTGAGPLASAVWAQPELPAAAAETPAARNSVPKTYLNKGVIQLPIQVDERARNQVSEIHLYVKAQPTGAWTRCAKAGWGQSSFTFQAPKDGEYWFGMVTVDQQGRPTPPDISKEEPGLIVVIDRQAPQVDVVSLGTSPDGPMVQCDFHDDNLDPHKARFFYQTGDKAFRPLDPIPGKTNVFCVPAQAVFTGQVRVSASDLAGNVVTRDFTIGQLPGAGQATPTVAKTNSGEPKMMPAVTQAPDLVPVAENTGDKGPVVIVPSTGTERPTHTAHKVQPTNATGPSIEQQPVVPDGPRHATPRRETVSSQRQVVNSPHVYLEYQIEQAGASGVGKVEVFVTRDHGQSWQRLCEDADRKSPAELDLPGEGTFGISLAISNGRGFGGSPPSPGDAPQWHIEVDTTKPTAEITGVRTIAEGGGTLVISYRATDKNFAAEGIDLYYAAQRQGPWQPIAKGLRNEGMYRWLPPTEVGTQAFVRLAARDQAGNTTYTETAQAVLLDDQSRPRAQIIGATTNIIPASATTPAQGN